MPLHGEILTHLGKEEIKAVFETPDISDYLKLCRAFSFIIFLFMYWLFFKVILFGLSFFTMVVPSIRALLETHYASGFWTFCVYFLELNDVKINVVGDVLENENALIIANHLSVVDHVIFPLLTRRTVDVLHEKIIDNESEEAQEDIGTEGENKGEEPRRGERQDKKLTGNREMGKAVEVPDINESKKEVKKGSKIRFKVLNNEEKVFAKDLSAMLIPKVFFFTWFKIWGVPTISYFKHISQADENWELDGETLVSIFHSFLDLPCNNTQWLILFPEVNIYSDKDLKVHNILGEKYYLPAFKNVLYPRFGAFSNAIGGLYQSKYSRLYDITLIYYNRNKLTGEIIDFRPPSLLSILGVRSRNIETVVLVHVAGKFLSRVPLKRNKLEKYLEHRWIKKDKVIEKLKRRVLAETESYLSDK